MSLDFTISYAGIPFILDSGKLIRLQFQSKAGESPTTQKVPDKHQSQPDLLVELNRLIPFKYLNEYTETPAYLGRNFGAIASQYKPEMAGNMAVGIGEWFYPSQATRWSVFRTLATSSQVAAILAATGGSNAATFIMEQNPISPGNPNNVVSTYTITTQMYMLPPRPLAELGGSFDGFYLVTLVDERYWWQYNPVTLQVNAGSTWVSLLSTLASSLGISLTYDPIPNLYQTPEPDSQFWTNQELASILLDAVAYNVGRVVVRNFDGTYSLKDPISSLNQVNINRGGLALSSGDLSSVTRVAGGDIFNSGSLTKLKVGDLSISRNAILPSLVRTTFPKYVVGNDPIPHFSNPRIGPSRPSCWYEESYGDVFIQDIPLASGAGNFNSGFFISGLVGVSGWTHTIHTTAKALFSGEIALLSGNAGSGGPQPLNFSGLLTLAFQLAYDFYNAQTISALDEVYPGTYSWTPEGYHDVIWKYSVKDRLATTRVMRPEWNQIVREMQHSTPPPSGQVFWQSGGIFSGQPQCYLPPGVGGPSVAQTIVDSWISGFVGGSSGTIIKTIQGSGIGSGDLYTILTDIGNLPTQNRWWGQSDGEIMMMEGTSGGISGFAAGPSSGVSNGGSGYAIGIVYRGVRGSLVQQHSSGLPASSGGSNSSGLLFLVNPNAVFGVNLTTYEKGQFIHPAEWTSGGIQGIHILPQVQNIQVLDTTGTTINGKTLFSGLVCPIDPGQSGGSIFTSGEFIWALERNGTIPTVNNYYQGQLVGYSSSGPVAPVYAFNVGGGGTGGSSGNTAVIRIGAQFSANTLGSGIIQSWADGIPPTTTDQASGACWVVDVKQTIIYSGFYQGTFVINHSGNPVYAVDTGVSSGYSLCLGDGADHTMTFVQGRLTSTN